MAKCQCPNDYPKVIGGLNQSTYISGVDYDPASGNVVIVGYTYDCTLLGICGSGSPNSSVLVLYNND